MIMMATAAILGAALGLFVRPRLLGVALAVLLIAGVEGGVFMLLNALHAQPNREVLIGRIEAVFGEDWVGAAIPVGVAFIGAVLAAVMGTISDPKTTVSVFTGDEVRRKAGKDGRYARVQGMVEDRQIHKKAESRIDSILGL
jgi:hypothetical protein